MFVDIHHMDGDGAQVGVPQEFQEHHGHAASGEQRLMQAIVTQAVSEALGRIAYSATGAARVRVISEARQWILDSGTGFTQACDLAGMDADWIRDRLRGLVADGWESNALPGQGNRRRYKSSGAPMNGTNRNAPLSNATDTERAHAAH